MDDKTATMRKQPPERPALIFFYGRTSGPSRRAEGFLAQVLQRNRNHETFRLYRVEAEERPDLVDRFRVRALPALIVVERKRVRARLEKPGGARAISDVLGPWLHAAGREEAANGDGSLLPRG